jgi:hypothetical protein
MVAWQKLNRQPLVFTALMLEVSASPLLAQAVTKKHSFIHT